MAYLNNTNITVSIGISSTVATPPVWTYAEINGLDNVSESLNEVVQQYQFLENAGFAVNHVTGLAPAWTLSGRRLIGDPGQDYIASKKYSLGAERQSSLKIVYTANLTTKTITVPCTICNIVDIGGGASTDDSVFSVEIRFDGAPSVS